ncbi:MAG: iron donor protein CyaY [Planctomycetota bacterium]
MDKQAFLKLADTCLAQVTTWLETFDPDEVDFAESDGVVKIQFPDGVTFVLNRQTAADQMWFAAGVRAWHYVYDERSGTWHSDKDQHELLARIAEVVADALQREVAPIGPA